MSTIARMFRASFWRHAALLWVWCWFCAPASVFAGPLSKLALPSEPPLESTALAVEALPGLGVDASARPFSELPFSELPVGELRVEELPVEVLRGVEMDASAGNVLVEASDAEGEVPVLEDWVPEEWPSPLVPLSQAPLCDPTGSSVLAPLPVLPSSGGEIQACWEHEWEVDDRLQPLGHDPPLRQFQALHDEATVASTTVSVGVPSSSLLSRVNAALPASAGHRRSVERPPRG